MGANKVETGKGGTFVICEICDGYIKDLEQLRTHMQWIHKVCLKIMFKIIPYVNPILFHYKGQNTSQNVSQ